MKPPHFRINRVMIWVAVTALNLAVLRALFASRRVDILGGGAMIWIMLQIGVFRAIRYRGQGRSYWLGFLGGGTVAMLSYLLASSFKQSFLWMFWKGYLGVVVGLVERVEAKLIQDFGYNAMVEVFIALLYPVAWFIPILLAALVTGLLTRLVVDGSRRTPKLAGGPVVS
jgi:hypothetical protein